MKVNKLKINETYYHLLSGQVIYKGTSSSYYMFNEIGDDNPLHLYEKEVDVMIHQNESLVISDQDFNALLGERCDLNRINALVKDYETKNRRFYSGDTYDKIRHILDKSAENKKKKKEFKANVINENAMTLKAIALMLEQSNLLDTHRRKTEFNNNIILLVNNQISKLEKIDLGDSDDMSF